MNKANSLARTLACGLAAGLATTPVLSHAATLYVDANVAAAGRNAVLAYRIAADGSLSALRGSPFPTNGRGYIDNSFKLGPFDHDQELTIDAARDVLYAVNGGSNTVSAFLIAPGGGLSPVVGQPFRSHGSTPVSLGLRGDLLTIVNNAQDPAQSSAGVVPSITVARVGEQGELKAVSRATIDLPATDQPSQALTKHTAPFVFDTSQPNDPSVRAFYQYPDGTLLQTDKVVPPAEDGVQPFPLGLWSNPNGPYLYVGLDFVTQTSGGLQVPSKLGVYRWSPSGRLTLVREAASAGGALCWIRGTKDGKRLYTSNTFDNSVSVFDVSAPDSPVEVQHLVIGGSGGLEQLALTPDEKYLYVLQEINSTASIGHSNVVYALAIDGASGQLSLKPDLTVRLPVSADTRPFGIVIK